MLQPMSIDSSPCSSSPIHCSSPTGAANNATTNSTEKKQRTVINIKNMNALRSVQRRKGGGGGGGTTSSGYGGGGDGGSPSSLSSETSSSSSILPANNTSPLNPCLLVLLVLVVLSMNIQSMIQLDSPLLSSYYAADAGQQEEQQHSLLRKAAIPATTEQQQQAISISSVSSVQNVNETFQKSLASVAAEKKKQQPYLYTAIPPRTKGIVPDIVKPGDFIYYTQPNGNSTDWDSSPIVIEKYKLVFFTTAKVGCTVWKQLFRRIMGYQDWKSQENGLPHDPAINGLRYLSSYSLAQASIFMTDPTWTRAIMVRDPKTRFLSSFLDKAVGNYHEFIRARCCQDNFACIQKAQNIPGFLNLVKVCNDGHWRRQNDRVDAKYWPYIDYVLHVENAANDARTLLQHVGAWEEYGASGWAQVIDEKTGRKKSLAIFESKDIQGAGEHATYSEWKHWEWYTPESERDVEAFYRSDYENPLFNFSYDCLTCIDTTNETTST